MITREEIERVAALMRIELDDHAVHADRVAAMVGYLDKLGEAGAGEGEAAAPEAGLGGLREDRHVPHGGDAMARLKAPGGRYVRAPGA